jgi:hypothetical protein
MTSTPSSTVSLHRVTFSMESHAAPSTDAKDQPPNTIKEKFQACCDQFERTRGHKFLRRYFRSNLYFAMGITLTLCQLIMSALAKILNERQVNAGANTLVIMFMIVDIYQVLECTTRIIVIHSYGSVFDGLILYTGKI